MDLILYAAHERVAAELVFHIVIVVIEHLNAGIADLGLEDVPVQPVCDCVVDDVVHFDVPLVSFCMYYITLNARSQ